MRCDWETNLNLGKRISLQYIYLIETQQGKFLGLILVTVWHL